MLFHAQRNVSSGRLLDARTTSAVRETCVASRHPCHAEKPPPENCLAPVERTRALSGFQHLPLTAIAGERPRSLARYYAGNRSRSFLGHVPPRPGLQSSASAAFSSHFRLPDGSAPAKTNWTMDKSCAYRFTGHAIGFGMNGGSTLEETISAGFTGHDSGIGDTAAFRLEGSVKGVSFRCLSSWREMDSGRGGSGDERNQSASSPPGEWRALADRQ
jgi:hypothetical protein